jgi:hypothetical protein
MMLPPANSASTAMGPQIMEMYGFTPKFAMLISLM